MWSQKTTTLNKSDGSNICQYYLHNSCKFGKLCRNFHIQNRKVCPKKDCKYSPDPKCKNFHELRKCKYFEKNMCHFKDNCWFNHGTIQENNIPFVTSMFVENNTKNKTQYRISKKNKKNKRNKYRIK